MDVVAEYETRLERVQQLLREHEELGSAIDEHVLDPVPHKEAIDAYLAWTAVHRAELEDFKVFVEQHVAALEAAEKNPVIMRDFVVLLLKDIDRLERDFTVYNRIWERHNN